MRIRPGDRRDAWNLAALAIQVWLHTYATEGISSLISGHVLSTFTPAKFEALLSDGASAILVAETGENLVGYAALTTATRCPVASGSKAELATLYVQQPFIGKGVGKALLGGAEQRAMQLVGTSLWLTVNARNFPAIAFYAKHGYVRRGVTDFELGDTKHENLVLVGPDA